MKSKILLLHVPKLIKKEEGNAEFHISCMPMGMYTIAGALKKKGVAVEMMHLGVEIITNPGFDIGEYIVKERFTTVVLALHWHQQMRDVLDVAKHIKSKDKNCLLLVGGYTASAFSEDILRNCYWIDGVIKGEAEIPLLRLAEEQDKGTTGNLALVPNLWWRNARHALVINKDTWVASAEELDEFDVVAGLQCLQHRDICLRSNLTLQVESHILYVDIPTFFLPLGRGCPGNCAWCGGGHDATVKITGRKSVVMRSPSRIADDVVNLWQNFGLGKIYTGYDPFHKLPDRIMEVFRLVGTQLPKTVVWDYECFGLPTREFIQSFKNNLHDDSCIIISPDLLDEEKRAIYKSFAYSNKQLFECLDYLEQQQVKVQICLADIPEAELGEEFNRNWIKENLEKYTNVVGISIQKIGGFEPYSPWILNPDKYGVSVPRCDFKYYMEN